MLKQHKTATDLLYKQTDNTISFHYTMIITQYIKDEILHASPRGFLKIQSNISLFVQPEENVFIRLWNICTGVKPFQALKLSASAPTRKIICLTLSWQQGLGFFSSMKGTFSWAEVFITFSCAMKIKLVWLSRHFAQVSNFLHPCRL